MVHLRPYPTADLADQVNQLAPLADDQEGGRIRQTYVANAGANDVSRLDVKEGNAPRPLIQLAEADRIQLQYLSDGSHWKHAKGWRVQIIQASDDAVLRGHQPSEPLYGRPTADVGDKQAVAGV